MADDSSVLVELQLAAQNFEASLAKAKESFAKSVSGMDDEARAAGADIDLAFSSLGIQSIEKIRYEITTLQQAFNTLRTSGTVSAEDIARAEAQLLKRVEALNASMGITTVKAKDVGEQVSDAFNKLGLKSVASVKAEIDSLQSAFDTLRTSGTVSAEEIARAEELLAKKIEALNASIGITATKARESGAELDSAFSALGLRSIESLRYEITTLQQAFNTLRTSGTVSAEDIARAEAQLTARVSALNAEINKTRDASFNAGKALQSAFSDAGVRSTAEIEREIRAIEIALQRLGQNAKVSGADFDRAFASGQARIKALEAEMAGAIVTTNRATAANESYSRSIGGMVRNAVAWASAFVGIRTAIGAGREVLQTGAAFETLEKRLTGLLGSSSDAKKSLQDIKDLAATTPFEVMDLSDAFVRLTSFGMKPSNDMMRSLTDTVAALGGGSETLQRVTLALGQAWVKGKLQGDEIMQLTEAGVPVWDALARATGRNTAELAKMSEAGQLGRDVLSKLIVELGKTNAGASAIQMDSFAGALSNAKDALTDFLSRIADAGSLDYFKRQIQSLLAEVERMKQSGELDAWAKKFSDAMIAIAEAAKTSIKFIKDNADAIKLLLEAMAVKKVLDFTAGLYAQAKAATAAAIQARILNAELNATKASSAISAAASATAVSSLSSITIGARAAAVGMVALRVAMRGLGIGLIIEGLSRIPDLIEYARKKASIYKEGVVEQQQKEYERFKQHQAIDELLAKSQDTYNGKLRDAISLETERAARLGIARTAAVDLGVDLAKFGTQTSESFNKSADALSALVMGLPQLKAAGIDAGAAIAEAIGKMAAAAKNQTEINALTARVKSLGDAGILSGEQVTAALEKIRTKSDELKDGINSVEEAFRSLGIKTPQELKAAADKATQAFDIISKSGTASAGAVREAFTKYAEAVLAANGGVVTDSLRVKAAMSGMRIEVDQTGKALINIDASRLDTVSSKADKAAGSLRGARDASDAFNDSLSRRPTPQRQGADLSGTGPQPDGLTVEQMKAAGWSMKQIEDYQINRGADQKAGETKHTVYSSDVRAEDVAREAGLRGDAVKRFADIFGGLFADKKADFDARMKSDPLPISPAAYRDLVNGIWKEAVEAAKVQAQKAPQQAQTGKQTVVPVEHKVHKVELSFGGQTDSMFMFDEKSVESFLRVLERSKKTSAAR